MKRNLSACRMVFVGLVAVLSLAVTPNCTRAQENVPAAVTVIHAGRFFDAKAGKMLANQDILIRGNKIAQVGANLVVPAGAKEIDLRKATVLPGFIDAHTHLASSRARGRGHRAGGAASSGRREKRSPHA